MNARLLIPFLVASAVVPATAAVYLNDVVIDDAANIPNLASYSGDLGRVFHLTESPNGFVVVEVNRIGFTSNFEFIYRSIAGEYDLCQVASGEELTYQNVFSKPGLGSFVSTTGNKLTLTPGQETYIGYWAQRGGKPPAGPESNDIFGWARVRNNGGNLVVLSSASADTGIIVGTTQAIPEPGPAFLASAGSLFLFFRRRSSPRR